MTAVYSEAILIRHNTIRSGQEQLHSLDFIYEAFDYFLTSSFYRSRKERKDASGYWALLGAELRLQLSLMRKVAELSHARSADVTQKPSLHHGLRNISAVSISCHAVTKAKDATGQWFYLR